MPIGANFQNQLRLIGQQTDITKFRASEAKDAATTKEFLSNYNNQNPSVASAGRGSVYSALRTSRSKVQQFQFPSDLFTAQNENQTFIIFNRLTGVAQPTLINSIMTYMPPSVKVNYQNNWTDITDELQKTMSATSDLGGAGFDQLAGIVTGSGAGNANSSDTLKLAAARGLQNAGVMGNIGDSTEVSLRKLRNPHKALMYMGPSFRSFSFDYWMMAQNEAETRVIRDIIREFKLASHPAVDEAGSSTWGYPDSFMIYIMSPSSEFLFTPNMCVLEGIFVDYTPEQVSFFENGAPVDVRFTLQFKEIALVTRKDILERNC